MGIQCTLCGSIYAFETPMAACPGCATVHNQCGHKVEINPAAVQVGVASTGAMPAEKPKEKLVVPLMAEIDQETNTATIAFGKPAVVTDTGKVPDGTGAAPIAFTGRVPEAVEAEKAAESAREDPKGFDETAKAAEKTPCQWCKKAYVDVEHHELHCKKKPKEPKPEPKAAPKPAPAASKKPSKPKGKGK